MTTETENPDAPAPVDAATLKRLRNELTDIGVSLAFQPNSAGIAAEFVSHLRDKVTFTNSVENVKVSPVGLEVNPAYWTGLQTAQRARQLAHNTLEITFDVAGQSEQLGLTTGGIPVPGKERERDRFSKSVDATMGEILKRDAIGAPLPGEFSHETIKGWVKHGSPAYDGDLSISGLYHYLLKYTDEDPPEDEQGEGGGGGGGGKQQGKGQGGGGDGQGSGDQDQPAPGQGCTPSEGSPVEPGEAEAMRAGIRAIGTGTALAEALTPKRGRTGWRQILRATFEHACAESEDRTQRSYSRASRRQFPDIILPGSIGTQPTVSVMFDVSGSMGEDVATIAGEALKLCDEFPDVSVFLTAHTSDLVYSNWLRAGGDVGEIKKATSFSGGTDAGPAYVETVKQASKVGGKFDAMVHFTDGYLPSWPEPPARRFVAGITGPQGDNLKDMQPRPPKGARCIPIRTGK